MDLPAASDTPPAAPLGVPPEIHGLADSAGADRIMGWALDHSRPGHRLRLELRLGEEVIGAGVANKPRADLEANGIGDGQHAFEIQVPAELLPRVGEFRLFGFAADGSRVRVPVRMRRPAPKPAATAGAPTPGVAPEDVARLRAELGAQAKRLRELPEPKALQDMLAQHGELTTFVRAMVGQIDKRLGAVPTAEQVAGITSAQQELTLRQEGLADRCSALEGWMARLEQRLSDMPAAGTAEHAAPTHKMDFWLKLLFSLLVGSLFLALLVGVMMRVR